MNDNKDIVSVIAELKKQRNAIILAHNYVNAEIQAIADFCGDSLELSIKAADTNADVLVVCGVKFMAETAKILSPDTTVLMPRPDAGCPMADMVDVEKLRKFRAENPDTVIIAYVNTTAEVKSLVDICCTSGNAEKVVASIPEDKEILFMPDRNLGGNIMRKLGRKMQLWEGCCPYHDGVTVEMISRAREAAPDAQVLVHPECRNEVVMAADLALSTGAMLKYVTESNNKEFIVGTESGILFRMQRANPDKKFYLLQPEILCPDMKRITLDDVAESLRDLKYPVELPAEMISGAAGAIEKMIAL